MKLRMFTQKAGDIALPFDDTMQDTKRQNKRFDPEGVYSPVTVTATPLGEDSDRVISCLHVPCFGCQV